MRNAARQFHLHTEWPEAICVYMQGLNTPGQLTDPEGKRPGWQKSAGDQKDRDLKFFDAVLASLKAEYKVDAQRIHSTGHSNGGGFTYLLWEHRSDVFASMAPSGSAAIKSRNNLPPKPVFHIAGTNDPLVKFAWQKITIEALKSRHQCGPEQPWKDTAKICPSPIHAPVITLLTDKGHRFPPEAPALIARFFREYPKRPDSKSSTDAAPK
jgi:polyhydroxybutyrate depolymerase